MSAPPRGRIVRHAAAGLALAAAAPAAAQAPARHPAGPLAWPAPTRDARPWTRWWWLGSSVDSAGVSAQLAELAAAGFGGVEVTAIYGVRGVEPVPYLSPRWVGLLAHTVAEARRLGMRVDAPPGAGWRAGGPFVAAADANASLRLTADTVAGGATWRADAAGGRVEAATAVADDGRTAAVAAAGGAPRWTAPAGRWTVYAAATRPSGDRVKRPAPGGEGHAVDVFSRAAVRRYLDAHGARTAALPRGALRAVFHDSFEYTGDGSAELFAEFRRRRGYDLAGELPALAGRGGADRVARVKSDYRQTLDEMLLDHFVRPLADWAHARGSLSREQAHGSPGNLLDLYAAADVPETEIFGAVGGRDADPLVWKFASSAAHVAGRPLASAEAFTWLGEHFQSSLADVKRAADQLFVAGVNHLVYHGTAYSPPSAAWPGWQFYASSEFNPRNAIWRDLPALNAYVERVQAVLQAGRPDEDVLLYWPVWDSWHDTAGTRVDFRVHAPDWLHARPVGRAAAALRSAGYGFDYVSDRLLAGRVTARAGRLRAGDAEYAAVLVPRAEHVPPATLARLVALAGAGATVLFEGGVPADVPGLARLDARRAELAATARRIALGAPDSAGVRRAAVGRGRVLVGPSAAALAAAAGVRREAMVDLPGVHFVRRRTAAGREYFVAHGGAADAPAVDGWVPLAAPAAAVAIMDPTTGRAGLAETRAGAGGATEVRLQLAPGESVVLRAFDGPTRAPAWAYPRPAGPPAALAGPWEVAFVDGGPARPAGFRSDTLAPWTGRGDAEADRFAGTARYTLRFDAPAGAGAGAGVLLDLGRVAESARVRLNGRSLGTLVAPPFRVGAGPLRPAGNVLEVEVTNLSANRVRDLDRRRVAWKIFEDINFVGVDYRPFDAAGWPVRPSGLLGPVTVTPLAPAAAGGRPVSAR